MRALGIERPLHLAGWSTGGVAGAGYAIDHGPVASLALIGSVSPYGYGAVKADGTPCFPDYAGSGGGTASPDFVQRLAAGDRSTDSPALPRNIMNTAYWSPNHRESAEREELLLNEILKSRVGDDGYPGDSASSPNWPGVAPGSRGILPPDRCREALGRAVLRVHRLRCLAAPLGAPRPLGSLARLDGVCASTRS